MKIILIIIFYVTKVSAIVESQKIIPEFDPNHFHYMGRFSYGDGSSFGYDVAINSHTLVVTHSTPFRTLEMRILMSIEQLIFSLKIILVFGKFLKN